MKILQLDLIAFGPFTGKILDLSQGNQGLHIIFGNNESGKSSALRALRQFFYGIPAQSSDNFVHEYANMKVGARLLHSSGKTLSLVRKKGRSNTLRNADNDKPVDESELTIFLGGLKQEVFESMFGIDHLELVAGGEIICQAKGELGQLLFSAGTGAADIRSISEKLSAEAEELFAPRGSKPIINAALAGLKEATAALKQSEVPTAEWEQHDKALQEAVNRKATLEKELSLKEQTLGKLERIGEALPLVSRRSEILDRLASLTNAILLPEDFGERSRRLQADLLRAESDEEEASAALLELNNKLNTITIPSGLIEQSVVIEDLQQQLGSNNKAMQDRSQLLLRQAQHEDGARTALKNLGQAGDLEICDKLRLSVTGKATIQDLSAAKVAVERSSENARKNLDETKEALAALQAELAGLKQLRSTERLFQAVRRAEQLGAIENQIRSARNQQATVLEQIFHMSRKIVINGNPTLAEICTDRDWQKLGQLKVPTLETIENCLSDFERKSQALLIKQTQLKAQEQEGQELAAKLRKAEQEMETPTEEDLARSRGRREAGWRLVKQSWKQQSEDSQSRAEFNASLAGASGDLAQDYESCVGDADQVADRLRREADRVATKAALITEQARQAQRTGQIEAEISQAAEELDRLEKQWQQLWQPAGLLPLTPREMRGWLLSLEDILKKVREANEAQINLNSQLECVAESKQELGSLLEELSEPGILASESLAGLITRCSSVVEANKQLKNQHDQLLRDINNKRQDLTRWSSEAIVVEKELQKWKEGWATALRPLGLGPDTTIAEAGAVIRTLDDMFANLSESRQLANRIAGIDRDDKTFAENVRKLVCNVAVDLGEFPPAQATGELNARLKKARTDRTAFQMLSKDRDAKLDSLQRFRLQRKNYKEQLERMCLEAQCAGYEDLTACADRSAARMTAQNDRKHVEELLLRLSGGLKLDEFVQEVLSFDPDSIEPRINILTEEIQQRKSDRTVLDQKIGSEKTELSKIDGSGAAAEHAENVQNLLAHIGGAAEQYARLCLSKYILTKGIERYREKNQNPVLRRASEIFAGQTLGSFAGLREDYNDKGEQVLVGCRPGGTLLGVPGMSDGTRDQLYLALRLASLETYLENKEAVPFIADDLMINFDDKRALETLRNLLKVSRKTQVVFFTHHQHLLNLINMHVDSKEVFVHRLQDDYLQPGAS
jgi:uncharacterized protein YhaN